MNRRWTPTPDDVTHALECDVCDLTDPFGPACADKRQIPAR